MMMLSKTAIPVGLISVLLLPGCGSQPTVVEERSVPRPVTVKTVALSSQEIQTTSRQPATVHPLYRAELRARISGYVAEVNADIGKVVEAGEVLAVIDAPELKKQRSILEAQISRQKAQVKRADAEVALAESKVAASKASMQQVEAERRQAEAQLAAAEAEFKRTSDLVNRRSLEQRMLDEVRERRDSSRAQLQAASSAIASAQAQIGVTESAVLAAKADVTAAKAELVVAEQRLEELNVLLGFAQIKAPFPGVITERTVEPGNLVRDRNEVGQGQPLFVVSDLSSVRIHIPVPERDAAYVNDGDDVELFFPAFDEPGSVEAKVTRRTGDLDSATRTMLVEVQLENSEGRFLPGMFGEAAIQLGAKTLRNVLPARAVRFSETGEPYVYVITDDNTVTKTSVSTGYDDGSVIEITSGIPDNQLVVDAHRQRLQDGQSVQEWTN